MTPVFRRLVRLSAAASLVVALSGAGWELVRFGTTDAATAERLEREVRNRLLYQSRRVESLADSVAREAPIIRDALTDAGALRDLFSRLAALRQPVDLAGSSATVYVPRASGTFDVLAWSEGPAESLDLDRLAGPPTLFVASGASGLRLVAVRPVEHEGRQIGVAAAETAITLQSDQTDLGLAACTGRLNTSYGPVVATAQCRNGPLPDSTPNRIDIQDNVGSTLLAVTYDSGQLRAQRRSHRLRFLAATILPFYVLLLLLTGPFLRRRNRAATPREWNRRTAGLAVAVMLLGLAGLGISMLVDGSALAPVMTGLTGLALSCLIPGGLWWRPFRTSKPGGGSFRFLAEHALGGLVVAATVGLLSRLLQNRVAAATVGVWQFPVFPFDAGALLHLASALLAQIALCWAAASVLGVLANRWRLGLRRLTTSLSALLLWVGPTLLLVAAEAGQLTHLSSWLLVAVALSAFGLLSRAARRLYRQTTQPLRFVLLFGALAAPPLATYPLSAAATDDAARTLIETEFAPAILGQPDALLARLAEAQQQIDDLVELEALVSSPRDSGSRNAYLVWSRTSLAAARLTSEVELFGPDRRLVSRFALNVPEYPYEEVPTWSGSGCRWDVFAEVARTGSQERVMLHAERGVCDASGALAGAVVVHAVSDYQALPFIGSGSPYAQALRPDEATRRDARLTGLQVVVYGWNDAPLFTSSGTAWPVKPDLSQRLYESRDSFWTTLSIGSTPYAVHFANDRRGFYALGYPFPTFMEHATRLTEITSIVAVLLIVLLLGSTAYAPLMQAAEAPLPALFRDIRTSFYRKLFLFFVLAAVGPVILLALAFGAYTSARIQADVESEALSAVAITQRLFEEFMALSDQGGAMVSDELMVVIRQMTQQDANLYIGPRLAASSQRDLFDSGLLSTRTPAGVYQAIAIDRLPAYVGEDRIGTFRYLVAAAPISGPGGEARILTVPLGTRQREIEHEIDELMRRMLAGAVVVLLFAAGLGASVAARVADPVARLSRAARQIAAGRLDVRIVADTADELRRLVDDFNVMTETLATQRAELARSNQLKAWAQMARQVAHEIKNPLTPIQLAAEHLQRVHSDRQKPLGPVVDQCVGAILAQVRLLRQIASDFSNFAAEPTPRFQTVDLAELLHDVTAPYRPGGVSRVHITTDVPPALPPLRIDRTLISRALTNLIENAIQAMPQGGTVAIRAWLADAGVALDVRDTGVGMDLEAAGRAFEPYFSTKTGGSGLGLPNAKRYVELSGGSISLVSAPGEGTTVTLTLPVALPDGGESG